MEDIEDLMKADIDYDLKQIRNFMVPKAKRKKTTTKETSSDSKETFFEDHYDSYIPGKQYIFIKTWGCSHNNSDSEYMAGQLAVYGFTITDDRNEAHLWLLNSCTVKNPAEDHLRNFIKDARESGKKVVVAGCVSQGAPKSEFLEGISVVGVQQIDRVVEVVEETLKGNSVRLLGPKRVGGKKLGGASLSLPKIRKNPLIEVISISTGCLNQCTYCKTKHARGDLGSYPIEEIVDRAKQSFTEGVCEIWLTSEDTGAYGRDIGVTLPDLLLALVEIIPDGCRLRLGMTNPPYILDHLENMCEILNHPKVYSFLHLPVQSGSDSVLADMKREYSVADFCKVVDTLRSKVPGITLATDIICGFPTEMDEDFEATLNLCKKYKFPSLFINQFYPRPSTPAARLTRIPTQEVKRRTRKLSAYFQSYEPYRLKVGELQTILVTEESHDGLYWVGHNKFYEQVLITKEKPYLGKMVQVLIESAGKHYMRGKPVTGLFKPVNPSISPPLPKGQVSGLPQMLEADDLPKQEKIAVLCFVFLIIALIVKFSWVSYNFIL